MSLYMSGPQGPTGPSGANGIQGASGKAYTTRFSKFLYFSVTPKEYGFEMRIGSLTILVQDESIVIDISTRYFSGTLTNEYLDSLFPQLKSNGNS